MIEILVQLHCDEELTMHVNICRRPFETKKAFYCAMRLQVHVEI